MDFSHYNPETPSQWTQDTIPPSPPNDDDLSMLPPPVPSPLRPSPSPNPSQNPSSSRVLLTRQDEESPRALWWKEAEDEFLRRTGKRYLNCQQRMANEVKKRRRAKASEDPGDDPGTTNAQRELDSWIDWLDSIEEQSQRLSAEKLAKKRAEQIAIERVQLNSISALGRRARNRTPELQDEDSLDEDEIADRTGGESSRANSISRGARGTRSKRPRQEREDRLLVAAERIIQRVGGPGETGERSQVEDRLLRMESTIEAIQETASQTANVADTAPH